MMQTAEAAHEAAEDFVNTFHRIREEVSKFIVGQQKLVEDVLLAILCGGACAAGGCSRPWQDGSGTHH